MKNQKAVALMIKNDTDKILLMKRGIGSRYESGKWELCGGAVDDGESFEISARREALEELGIEIQIVKELIHDEYTDMGDGINWEIVVYEVKTKDSPKIMEPHKCEGLRWVTKKELIGMGDDLVTHLKEDLLKLGWIVI